MCCSGNDINPSLISSQHSVEAVNAGVSPIGDTSYNSSHWDLGSSFFFAGTVITTIGNTTLYYSYISNFHNKERGLYMTPKHIKMHNSSQIRGICLCHTFMVSILVNMPDPITTINHYFLLQTHLYPMCETACFCCQSK